MAIAKDQLTSRHRHRVKNPLQIAARLTMKIHYWLWLVWRGHGRPLPADAWDRQYRLGQWNHLNSLDELDRYAVIAGYIRFFFEQAEILDVGCGHGGLLRVLQPECFKQYLGIDISHEAVS